MKIILIKDCKDGKANTVIDVSDGYGMNFLVRQGFGVPYNTRTKRDLDNKLSELTNNEMDIRKEALALKEELEKLELSFTLDAKIDANGNLNVHGAVSTKDIVKMLAKKGYEHLDKHAIQKVRLISNDLHYIDVNLYKDIIAKLKVVVKLNAK
ncbi:50S ribosomal protein L9 [Mycoplasma sp. Mirounga ES2805-ORL]|uniref:50S ribosomal protein L9 n=1 Tax=Mycoplasma sp. Mirounga ES2805-ORL TaxID=754514 RepID=UPI00197B36BF|nr:50S ribosomal protein L9 [Mycoplasma sp. Mirounga ES2805-ORL]QSF13583.1 50S ribosomal protein L9 [Mycoplasma sp. Mirounga ES2805-ORL]